MEKSTRVLKLLQYVFTFRDTNFTIPTFYFYFKVNIPKPNKERIITQRDRLGRIVAGSLYKTNILI